MRPTHSQPAPLAVPAHELPEYTAYLRKVTVSGAAAQEDPDEKGFTKPALANDFKFEVLVNMPGQAAVTFPDAGFGNPVPSQYKIRVALGATVFVQRTGRVIAFAIPWIPFVKKCPGTPPPGGSGLAKRPPVDPTRKTTGPGGGNTQGTQGGQSGTGSGEGTVGVPPRGGP